MSKDIASFIEPKSVPAVTDTLRDWVKDFDDRHRISMSEVHAELSQELEDSLAAEENPRPTRHANAVLKTHCVSSHPVSLPRPIAVKATITSPATCTIIDADPVEPMLYPITELTVPMSAE